MTATDPDRVCPEALKAAADAARHPCNCPRRIAVADPWCPRHGNADGIPDTIAWGDLDARTLARLAELTERHGPWEAARIVFADQTAERTQ